MEAVRRHVFVGASAGIALIGVYFGIITLAQGFGHALQQTVSLWYWVLALAGGFGIQAGLYSFTRRAFSERRAAAAGTVAASGGMSAGSMAACCAHHLSDFLPLFGLSGLAVTLARYQTPFIVTGVMSNIVGISFMLETMQNHRLSERLARLNWNLAHVKILVLVLAAVVIAAAFLTTLF